MGPADSTDLAVIAGLGAVAALLGLGLMLGGRTLPLAIGALLVALMAIVVITLPVTDVTSRFVVAVSGDGTNVLVAGPGPYIAALGVLLWLASAIAALISAPSRQPAASHKLDSAEQPAGDSTL